MENTEVLFTRIGDVVLKSRYLTVEVCTVKFGVIRADARDIICFPEGLPGLEDCRRWVILADPNGLESPVMWLQSVDHGEIALPVVAPSHYVPQYRVRVDATELKSLQIERDRDVEVLAVLNRRNGITSINLKAPLVVNMASRIGRQVITAGSWSVRHMVVASPGQLRQSA